MKKASRKMRTRPTAAKEPNTIESWYKMWYGDDKANQRRRRAATTQ